ncbi:MAG: VOC family protein [Acidimicrobiales bacterium]
MDPVLCPRVKILGIHHVAIQASDIDAAREFYGEVMGLTEIERPAFPFDGLWFRLGAQALHIVAQDDHVAPDRQHFAVEVDDLDAAVSAIEARGVPVRKLGLTYEGAGYQAFVRDPSGNSIELHQPE